MHLHIIKVMPVLFYGKNTEKIHRQRKNLNSVYAKVHQSLVRDLVCRQELKRCVFVPLCKLYEGETELLIACFVSRHKIYIYSKIFNMEPKKLGISRVTPAERHF